MDLSSLHILSQQRIAFLRESKDPWYQGHSTYMRGLREEIAEVEAEILAEKRVYLEDELADVLWDYLCLLSSLQDEGRIDAERILQRAERKYSERILSDGSPNGEWSRVKALQKERLQREQTALESEES